VCGSRSRLSISYKKSIDDVQQLVGCSKGLQEQFTAGMHAMLEVS
jgi:hypothetical protein